MNKALLSALGLAVAVAFSVPAIGSANAAAATTTTSGTTTTAVKKPVHKVSHKKPVHKKIAPKKADSKAM